MGQAQAPGQKLALVVGVSDYGRERAAQEAAGFVVPPALANAVRDSELVASALEAKGFTVTRVTNTDKRALLSALNTLASTLGRARPDACSQEFDQECMTDPDRWSPVRRWRGAHGELRLDA